MNKKLIFLLLFLSTILSAQEKTQIDSLVSKDLSLKNAIEFALINNPEINKIQEQINVKNGEWWSSFGLNSPTLKYAREGIDKNIANSFSEERWHLEQSIDFPITTYFRLNKISFEKDFLNDQLKNNTKELIANVKSSYVNVLYSKKVLSLREKQIKLAEQLKKAVTSKLEAGDIAELEMMKSEIQLAEAQNLYEDATQAFHQARYSLFRVIGLDPSKQKYSIEFQDSLSINLENFSQSEVLTSLEKQPLISSYQNLLESSSYGVKEAWSSFLPEISFNYFKQDFGTGYNFYGYELGLSVPVWFLFNQNGSIQKAQAINRENQWSLKDAKLKIKSEIENAWHGYETSKAKIKKYDSTIRTLADELQKSTLIGYQLGEIDLLRLLDAQKTYLDSEINYFNTLKEYYQQIIQLEKYVNENLIY